MARDGQARTGDLAAILTDVTDEVSSRANVDEPYAPSRARWAPPRATRVPAPCYGVGGWPMS